MEGGGRGWVGGRSGLGTEQVASTDRQVGRTHTQNKTN